MAQRTAERTDVEQVLDLEGQVVDPALDPGLSDDELLELYRLMIRTRTLDERGVNLQRQGRIGFYVPSLGQEASHIGATWPLRDDDWIYPSYRDPGILFVRGVDPRLVICQLYGNADDETKGRQMPCHFSYADHKFVSISSPIGTQIIQAAGTAIAARIKGDDVVSMCFFGDGGTSSNDFHSGMNFAGVRKAPCLFVCQNNGWAISLPVAEQTASETMVAKADAYGMRSRRVDGNDILAMIAVVREEAALCRAGEGPVFLESVTFRVGPHSTSDDPTRYRAEDEVEEWRKRDPIQRFQAYLRVRGLLTDELEEEVATAAKEEIQAAIKSAEKVPLPDPRTIFEDVYAEMPAMLEEQYQDLLEVDKTGPAAEADGEFPL
jgi:pyruvate dehydrogenase E1 component alpha subunit